MEISAIEEQFVGLRAQGLSISQSVASNPVGRPRAIDESDAQKLVALFKKGHTVATACRTAGVPRSTFYAELARRSPEAYYPDCQTCGIDQGLINQLFLSHRPFRQMHAGRRFGVGATHKVLVQFLGQEWQDRCQQSA